MCACVMSLLGTYHNIVCAHSLIVIVWVSATEKDSRQSQVNFSWLTRYKSIIQWNLLLYIGLVLSLADSALGSVGSLAEVEPSPS